MYSLHISNTGILGTNDQKPAEGQQYTITATPIAAGNPWWDRSCNEKEYRNAAATLVPEKEAALLTATANPGDLITTVIGPGELMFSLEELQGMGLTEQHD